MRALLVGIALLALAGCSAGDDASAAPGAQASNAAALPEDRLPEDTTPGTAQKYLTSLTNPPQAGRWHPRDECIDQPGALAFREKLAAAVLAKDADGLAALAAKDIVLDFGGGSGTAELKKRLADPEQGLWKALQNVIPLGCAAGAGGDLTMPWYFAQDIPVEDPYFAMIVKGVNVPLLDAPKGDARVLKRLSWDVVELRQDPGAFAQVTAGGKAGYVETAKLRAIIDYRLIAEKQADGWKLTAFVAGD